MNIGILYSVFLGALFLIPILNLLCGAVVGLSLLFTLLSQGRYLRIFASLPLALMWFAGSLYWTAKGVWVVVLLVLLVVSTVSLFHLVSKTAPGYQKQLDLANAADSSNFSFDCAFGEFNTSAVVCVDQVNKKIAFIWENSFRIEPFSFLRSWDLNWTEVNDSRGNLSIKNTFIKLETRDFESPVIKIKMENKALGESWIQRLNIMSDVST